MAGAARWLTAHASAIALLLPRQDGEGEPGGEYERPTEFPVNRQQLTTGPEWLASVMGVPILKMDLRPCRASGDFACDAYRARLTYKEVGSSTEEVIENTLRLNYPIAAVVKLSGAESDGGGGGGGGGDGGGGGGGSQDSSGFRRYLSDVSGLGACATEFFAYTTIHPQLELVRVPRIYGCFVDNPDEVRK